METVNTGTFNGCMRMASINFPIATTIGSRAFYNCDALTSVKLPEASEIGGSAFEGCAALSIVDLPKAATVKTYAFENCAELTTVILRTGSVCTIDSTAFKNTPIVSGTGYLYVPSALLNSYKETYAKVDFANQFRAIEDYPAITGG